MSSAETSERHDHCRRLVRALPGSLTSATAGSSGRNSAHVDCRSARGTLYNDGVGARPVVVAGEPNRLLFWSMTTLPLSEVKARLSEIAEEVATTHERVQVTKNGRDYVVLLAAEDLESLEATLELLSDHAAQARVLLAERDIELGQVLDEEAVRALLSGTAESE